MDLTEEQRKFLEDVEEEFKDRFSKTDAVYWEEHTSEAIEPPILDPWYNKPRRRFDHVRRGRGNEANGSQERSNNDRFNYRSNRSPIRDSRGNRPRYDAQEGNRNHYRRDSNYHERDRARDRDREHRRSDGYSNRYSR